MSDKQVIKNALEARMQAELSAAEESQAVFTSGAQLDQDDVVAVDDLSQSDEDGDLAGLLEDAEGRRRSALNAVQALDFSATDVVGPGAVIAFGGGHYVVGIVTDAFDVDGVTYEGISPDSPLFSAIEGLRAGQSFTLGGTEHVLDSVE